MSKHTKDTETIDREFDNAVMRNEKSNPLLAEGIIQDDSKKKSILSRPLKKWLAAITWIIRIALGATFVFSGFSKCIDPWGTIYKMHDYLAAMSISIPEGLFVCGSFGLSILEFITGIFLAFGCFRRFTPFLTSAIMLFMLPLTLWIAISDPVADCGCFGDAYIISNWATFWKNVALSAGAIWLLVFNRRTGWLIRPFMQWMAVVVSGVYAGFIAFFGYSVQPLIDFRPFPIGSQIYSQTEGASTPQEFTFIYEKDGVKKEFSEDDELPDEKDGWVFIERKEIKSSANNNHSNNKHQSSFTVWTEDGEEEVTDQVLGIGGRQILLLFPDLANASIASSYTINSMNSWASSQEIDFSVIVSSSPEGIATWRDIALPSYPIYTAEDTSIKEVARGNPAVVYLEDGIIKWKRTLSSIPTADFLEPGTPDNPMEYSVQSETILRNATYIYIAALGLLIVLSFLPLIPRMFSLRHI